MWEKIFKITGIIYIKPRFLHPDEPNVLQNELTRYALSLNVLKTSYRFAGLAQSTADKLALGTGILFKSLTFVREGEFVFDFQVDIGRGVKFETNLYTGRESEGCHGGAQSRREFRTRWPILME